MQVFSWIFKKMLKQGFFGTPVKNCFWTSMKKSPGGLNMLIILGTNPRSSPFLAKFFIERIFTKGLQGSPFVLNFFFHLFFTQVLFSYSWKCIISASNILHSIRYGNLYIKYFNLANVVYLSNLISLSRYD